MIRPYPDLAVARPGLRLALGLAALGGFALGMRREARRAEGRHPPMGRFLQVGDARLHLLDRGIGAPPVVLLHGNGSMVEDFWTSGLVDRLAEERRVIVLDRPGFGYSSRPRGRGWTPQAQAVLVAETFRRLGLRRPIVVGHSWGSLVALALGLDHAEAVGGLVLLSGYYFPTARPDVLLFMPSALPVLGDTLRYSIAPVLSRVLLPRLLAKIFEPRPIPPAFATGFPTPLTLRPWQLRAVAEDTSWMIPAAAMLSRRYAGLQVPVSILAGAEDRMADPHRHSARLHRQIPGSTLTLVPGAGHMVHHAAPELVAEAVSRLGRGTTARQAA